MYTDVKDFTLEIAENSQYNWVHDYKKIGNNTYGTVPWNKKIHKDRDGLRSSLIFEEDQTHFIPNGSGVPQNNELVVTSALFRRG